VKRLGFRARLFLILLVFAAAPTIVLTLLWSATASTVLPVLTASAAWDRVAATGEEAVAAARRAPLDSAGRAALRTHEQELRTSLLQARRFHYLTARAVPMIGVVAVTGVLVFVIVASRVAGHLSRQLSRPIRELVSWTERIARGEAIPEGPMRRGAPEFEVLRHRMRRMARELERGRTRALEAERVEAFRETARRVAHELKNPLTPIRFAIERLRREAPTELADTVEVLAEETRRLEEMARSFGQFARLPEGPRADVDLAELVRYTARATVPTGVPLEVDVEGGLPMVRGHHDALARALSNVLINAVEACEQGGKRNGGGQPGIAVHVRRTSSRGRDAVEISVRDTGCGIPPEQLARIWEPYVTYKRGGTGLGLAIARQTIAAHAGEVDAASAPGEGTQVRFILPVEGAAAPGDAARRG
jgi:nitrogen fixation/metabolism regulation signal transduction histidine kinase